MRMLIQRVSAASVQVAGSTVGDIQAGILAYVGIGHDDTLETAKRMLNKLLNYRIFADDAGKLNLNVQQVNGSVLLVSQFTLMAATNKGLRPDFKPAMPFAEADALFNQMIDHARSLYPHIATGEFGADMQVHSTNDGPINFLLET